MNDLLPTFSGFAVNGAQHQQDKVSDGFKGLSFHAANLAQWVGQIRSDTGQ